MLESLKKNELKNDKEINKPDYQSEVGDFLRQRTDSQCCLLALTLLLA